MEYRLLQIAALILIGPAPLAAAPTAFGADVDHRNGRIEGHGVVWALEVGAVEPGTAAAEAGIQAGDIITTVVRRSPTAEHRIDTRSDQDAMIEMLSAAAYGDSYELSVLRPEGSGVTPLTLEARVPYPGGGEDFRYPSQLYLLIHAGDWDVLMLGARDPEARAGLRRHLSRMNYLYHTIFSALCAEKVTGDYVVISESLSKEYDDPSMDRLYGYEGWTQTWQIRRQFHPGWVRARQDMTGLGVIMDGSVIARTAEDLQEVIGLNGCDSLDLRQFETNLDRFAARANPI